VVEEDSVAVGELVAELLGEAACAVEVVAVGDAAALTLAGVEVTAPTGVPPLDCVADDGVWVVEVATSGGVAAGVEGSAVGAATGVDWRAVKAP
jgi:hypothetical protein